MSGSRFSPALRLPSPRLWRVSSCAATATTWSRSTPQRMAASTQGISKSACCSKAKNPVPPPVLSREFWTSRPTWRRAGINTFRCLVGCTLGDFSAMWYLQAFHPEMAVATVMGISMASGLSTSLLLETVLLKVGKDKLAWPIAAKTAAGMSMISMITMEAAENAVDYHLTGGAVQFDDAAFWWAALVSVAAGFLAPLPYNYHRLRKFGKACH
ncbi:hypothetical protein CTRI78_v011079 [Colletotrichum trifolii]|uniref:DUF4396 domain-containing protein n=1 Tax=Colletotrichum trifolii TaxID=5466 RepID=A0A4R8QKL8_COLTR|nr:hypothetical protein CTRI78_v011079 [Colletotrichum trifolii]